MPSAHVRSLHKHGVLGCSTHNPARGSDVKRQVEIEEESGRKEEGVERGGRGGREGREGGREGRREGWR